MAPGPFVALLSTVHRKDDLCFDIGAHVGNRVRVWRRLGARVIAVEPQPSCLAILRWFYGREPGVEIVPSAVGASRGRSILHASSATPTLSTTSADWVEEVKTGDRRFGSIQWDRQVEVNVVTLDGLIERYGEPTFCKIDVEGSELQVLEGLTRALPALSFEFLPVSRERPTPASTASNHSLSIAFAGPNEKPCDGPLRPGSTAMESRRFSRDSRQRGAPVTSTRYGRTDSPIRSARPGPPSTPTSDAARRARAPPSQSPTADSDW